MDNEKIIEFHVHLDKCLQCANQPFNLCLKGQRLLEKAAS